MVSKKSQWMIIPRPFPLPEAGQARAVRFPARPRWRALARRAHARLYLVPLRYLVALALAPLACLALVLLALRGLR